jgi:GNAT superfamily N-acetyltransferase
MTSATKPLGIAIAVRVLETGDSAQFHELGSHSTLESLLNPGRRNELLTSGQIFGAFEGRELVGCACLQPDKRCRYLGSGPELYEVPVPNVYLCSAFVRSDCRGLGVGKRLYSERLRAAISYKKPCLVVEILGAGTPSTPHHGARAGYLFHLARGFRVVGFSPDHDHGPVLVRYEPHYRGGTDGNRAARYGRAGNT